MDGAVDKGASERPGGRVQKGGRLEEVASGLFLVHATNEGRIPHAHSLLAIGRKNILVDTGLGPDVIRKLRRTYPVHLVLNSHYHRDHNWGNYLFEGVPIKAHRLDAPMLNSLPVYFRKMGIVGRGDERDIKKFTLAFIPHRQGPRAKTFSGGDVFGFGGPELEAVHLPGHSPGHCGFYHRESRTLFSGDICPDGFGPWYGHACSSAEDFARSVDRIIRLRPRKLLTAHTAPVRKDIAATLGRYKARIAQRDRHIWDILSAPATMDELIRRHPLYGPYLWALDLPYRFWEEMMVRKHVRRLLRRGKIVREGARYRAL
jgi:glyoxylase-like metal-dependent hydrolase (beta-lactamase superfamily II)